MNFHYLYRIINVLNNRVYIGQTKNPKVRWSTHKYYANKESPKLYIDRAMRKDLIINFYFEIIATCINQDDANYLEELLIKQYDSQNKDIGYNISPGGKVISGENHPMFGKKHTPETLQKLRAANIGKKLTTETKQKISASHKGKSFSNEQKQHISEALKGKIISLETKKNMSAGQKGRKLSSEHKNKISIGNKGKKLSAEHKAKLSALKLGKRGKPHSAETKQKMSLSRKGKPRSPEVKQKISASHKGIKLSPEHVASISAAHKKLTLEQECNIRDEYNKGQTKQNLMNYYNISISTINRIIRNKR